MSKHEKEAYLVTYDISNHKRLGKVFRFLKKHGIPLQYSVFAVEKTKKEMDKLIADLAFLIDTEEDDIRGYCVPRNTWRATLGASILPEDVLPGLWEDQNA